MADRIPLLLRAVAWGGLSFIKRMNKMKFRISPGRLEKFVGEDGSKLRSNVFCADACFFSRENATLISKN
jgi:hypothetical protein